MQFTAPREILLLWPKVAHRFHFELFSPGLNRPIPLIESVIGLTYLRGRRLNQFAVKALQSTASNAPRFTVGLPF